MSGHQTDTPLGRCAGAASLWAMGVGWLALVGWAVDVAVLTSVVPGFVTMKPNTAIAFILVAIALWILRVPRPGVAARRVADACAAAATLIGMLTLLEHAFGWELHLDEMVLSLPASADAVSPGRMSAASAFNFVLFGLALLVIDRPVGRRLWTPLAITVFAVGGVGMVGYFYNLIPLYRIPTLSAMAMHTAATFAVLSLGMLCARPERGLVAVLTSATAGGMAARRLLPVALVTPVLLGWIRLEGQRRGWYDTEVGVSLLALSTTVVIGVVVWWSARALDRSDGERRRHEESVQKSQTLFRELFESSPDAILLVRADNRIEMANRKATSLLGYDLADLAGRSIDSVVPRQFREPVALRRDGSEIPVEVTLTPIDTDGGEMMLCIARDVTERAEAAVVLEEARARLRSAVAAGHVGLWDRDLVTGRVYYSTEWKRQIGYADHEIQDSREEWESRIHPEDLPRVLERIEASVSGAAPDYEAEYRFRHRDGRYRHILARGSTLWQDNGTPARFLGSHVDITERVELQAQFLQAQKMESVGRLAGGVAHDFNNLLTVINGTADIVLQELKERDPLREDVMEIRGAGARAASLTRQLLAFSRKQILQPEVLDLNVVAADMHGMVQRLLGERIELRIRLATRLGMVRADRGQIEQVIMNLAVNARDAMPGGGVLTIETQDLELDAAYAAEHASVTPGPHVMLAVSDTGAGMDHATRRRIFEPFFTTKGPSRGTGLGLSTVYGIVKQTGGNIWVYSEPGRGTTLKVYLPRVDAPVHQHPPVLVDVSLPGTETILIVEDEAAVLRLASRFLQSAGYQILAAANGAEALSVLERHLGPVPLVVTDIVMPGMTGTELAAQLARTHPEARVLYTSGYTEDTILQHGMTGDQALFISKPYTKADLCQKVREALGSSLPE